MEIGCSGQGLVLATLSSFFFSLSSLVAKFVNLPPILLSWYGFLGLTLLSTPLLLNKKWSLPPKYVSLIVLRAVVGTLFLTMSFYAVELIPIGDASVLFYTAPVFTAILANAFLGEPCSVWSGLVILVIMLGIILVTRPPILFSGREMSPNYLMGVLMALGAAFTEAVSNVALRELKNVHYSVVMFLHGVLSLVLTSILIPFTSWKSAESPMAALLPLILACLTGLEQLMMTLALNVEQAGPVALVQASDVVFGYLYQIVFFGEEVNPLSVLGAAIVAAVVVKMAFTKSKKRQENITLSHYAA